MGRLPMFLLGKRDGQSRTQPHFVASLGILAESIGELAAKLFFLMISRPKPDDRLVLGASLWAFDALRSTTDYRQQYNGQRYVF